MHEYDCQRCGIHVIRIVDEPHPENVYCAECSFVEGIENEHERRVVAAFLDRIRAPKPADPLPPE